MMRGVVAVSVISVLYSVQALAPVAKDRIKAVAPLGADAERLARAGGTALSASPPTWLFKDLVRQEELEAVLKHVQSGALAFHATPSGNESSMNPTGGRIGKSYAPLNIEAVPGFRTFIERIDELFGADISSSGVSLMVVRTAPGSPAMPTHHDGFEDESHNHLTLNLYLTSAVHENSGRVTFEKAGVSVLPQAGTVLAFENSHPDAAHGRTAIHPEELDRLHVQIGLNRAGKEDLGRAFRYLGAVEEPVPTPTVAPTSAPKSAKSAKSSKAMKSSKSAKEPC